MAFKDKPIKKEICLPKQKDPNCYCRCDALEQILNGVIFSGDDRLHLFYVKANICNFCNKEMSR